MKTTKTENYVVDISFGQGVKIGNTLLIEIGHDKETGDMIIISK